MWTAKVFSGQQTLRVGKQLRSLRLSPAQLIQTL
jgi:hypothetical protein